MAEAQTALRVRRGPRLCGKVECAAAGNERPRDELRARRLELVRSLAFDDALEMCVAAAEEVTTPTVAQGADGHSGECGAEAGPLFLDALSGVLSSERQSENNIAQCCDIEWKGH